MEKYNSYISPFSTRYASPEMQYYFSQDFKFKTWRKLWLSLAKVQKELGLPITQEMIDELSANVDNINYKDAEQKEKEIRHDVMSHVYAYGLQCPKAKGIIHLGATSCFVGDNTDIIIFKKALELVELKLAKVISQLADFATKYKDMPTLAYTHLQAAQPTTVGKRACLWLYDFINDIEEIASKKENLKLRGCKGTTGTQASFYELFGGDYQKVKLLDKKLAQLLGFNDTLKVTGQTYSRKIDYSIMSSLSAVAQSAYKFANDMRLLQSFKEMEEPFGKKQVGSSAMPYKRNPMRCERICALSRYVTVDVLNTSITSSTQWLERSLDDSANKRISVSEGFLAIDAILNILIDVTDNIVVYEHVIKKRLNEELPFMATENIMMHCVKKGADRQYLHEKIREYSQMTANNIKLKGEQNNLLDIIAEDPNFNITKQEIMELLEPSRFTGAACLQVEEFISECAKPIVEKFKDKKFEKIELNV